MTDQNKTQALQKMLDKVKPKARFVSQMHVQQNIDSLMKQIVNGDIQIPDQRQSIQNMNKKKDFQSQIRDKLLNKVQRQKMSLQQKLSYINNSINSLKTYGKSKTPMNRYQSVTQLMQVTKEKQIQLKKQIRQDKKIMGQKRKKIEEAHKKKLQEQRQKMQKLKIQEQSRKKKQIYDNVKHIKQRMQSRQNQIKSGNQRLKQVLKQRKYHDKLSQNFNEKVNSQLEQRKKKLAQIRNLHKPIDVNQIQQHQQRFIEIKKQKQQLRQRQKKMNQSRSKTYRAPYQSVFYKKLLQLNQQDSHATQKIKMDKMKQFSQHVKNNFAPQVDQKKQQKIVQILEKQENQKHYWQQKHKQLQQKAKLKGLQYLQQVRKIPKKKSSSPDNVNSSSMQRGHLTQRPQYPNYLNRSVNMSQHKPWKTILKGQGDKQQKALLLHFQSQKVEEQLKRKEQKTRLAKMKDTGDIDQQYYEMIKAKLDLLQEPSQK